MFEGIPTFAPEHFARVSQMDSMKRKQFVKGVSTDSAGGCYPDVPGVQGQAWKKSSSAWSVCFSLTCLNSDLKMSTMCRCKLENLPYEHIRWIENKDEVNVDTINGTSDMKKVVDMKGNPLLLFINEWSIGMTLDTKMTDSCLLSLEETR